MAWPHWIEELKDAYLADEASVFLLYGDIGAARWDLDGELFDAARLLVRFLQRSKEIVGVLRPAPTPARLEFAEISDRARFENLVKAAEVLGGSAVALREADPHQALGRIWRALSTTGTPQAYIVTATDRLMPAAKKLVDQVPGAPNLFDWPSHPTLRASNNVLIFLAPSLESVRSEFTSAAMVIEVSGEPTEPVDLDAMSHLRADVTPPGAEPVETRAPQGASASTVDPGLRSEIEAAILAALIAHPEEHRPARLPVMDAVAQVLAANAPDHFGPLSFSLDADGAATVEGTTADAFQAAWRGDVALDAAAGMLLGAIKGNFTSQTQLDPTALGALTRRLERLLKSVAPPTGPR